MKDQIHTMLTELGDTREAQSKALGVSTRTAIRISKGHIAKPVQRLIATESGRQFLENLIKEARTNAKNVA